MSNSLPPPREMEARAQLLPDAPVQLIWTLTPRQVKSGRIVLAGSFLLSLFLWFVGEFLQARAIVSVHLSQFFLYFAAALLFLLMCLYVRSKTWRAVTAVVILLLSVGVDWLVPNPSSQIEDNLKKKYPMGYFLFTGDTQTSFVRMNHQSKADFSLDWENCRIVGSNKSFVLIRLSRFQYYPTHIEIQNLEVIVPKTPGTAADGVFFNNAGLFIEFLDESADEVVYVIGIRAVNSVPKRRNMDQQAINFFHDYSNNPLVIAMDFSDKSYIKVNNLAIAPGGTIADK